jgi:hypothetical protein
MRRDREKGRWGEKESVGPEGWQIAVGLFALVVIGLMFFNRPSADTGPGTNTNQQTETPATGSTKTVPK